MFAYQPLDGYRTGDDAVSLPWERWEREGGGAGQGHGRRDCRGAPPAGAPRGRVGHLAAMRRPRATARAVARTIAVAVFVLLGLLGLVDLGVGQPGVVEHALEALVVALALEPGDDHRRHAVADRVGERAALADHAVDAHHDADAEGHGLG